MGASNKRELLLQHNQIAAYLEGWVDAVALVDMTTAGCSAL